MVVSTPGEAGVTNNLKKKQEKADKMFSALVREMNNSERFKIEDNHRIQLEAPSWL
jgi:hypothetical protein